MIVQLAYPDLRVQVLGDDRGMHIFRTADTPDDDILVRCGRAFASWRGLHLYRYERAGTPRKLSDDTQDLVDSLYKQTQWNVEIFAPLGADRVPEASLSRRAGAHPRAGGKHLDRWHS